MIFALIPTHTKGTSDDVFHGVSTPLMILSTKPIYYHDNLVLSLDSIELYLIFKKGHKCVTEVFIHQDLRKTIRRDAVKMPPKKG